AVLARREEPLERELAGAERDRDGALLALRHGARGCARIPEKSRQPGVRSPPATLARMSDAGEARPRFRVRVETERVTLPNGHRVELDIVPPPGAAAVVLFVSDDEVLLIRQYRHAAGGTILEVPAGKLDPGEAPAACAARELEEEAGQRAGRLAP